MAFPSIKSIPTEMVCLSVKPGLPGIGCRHHNDLEIAFAGKIAGNVGQGNLYNLGILVILIISPVGTLWPLQLRGTNGTKRKNEKTNAEKP